MQDHLPYVTLITPIHNGGPHYPTCFEALSRLEYPSGSLEIHVIDDYSTDGTREYLQRQSPPDFIRLHFPEANLGRARVRNLALSDATGEVVILLDGDMEVQPDFLKAHVDELARPGREAVIGRVVPASWLTRSKLNRYLYEYPRRGARQFGPDVPIGFQYLLTNNLALSRRALEAGGPLEESFRCYGGEDTLFGYRLARKLPNSIFYSPQPVAVHHHNRTLRQHLKDFGDYGYHNLPRIITRYPEIATPLAADYAWPFSGNYFRRRRRAGRLLFNRLTNSLARALLPITPFPASSILVRFLTVSSVVRGLRRYVRNHPVEAQSPLNPSIPTER
ncbi:MAG: glycosyltransferase family 2 protein [Candidatus Neomarinimicrobiota bacterium]